jgi:hypothetical protein
MLAVWGWLTTGALSLLCSSLPTDAWPVDRMLDSLFAQLNQPSPTLSAEAIDSILFGHLDAEALQQLAERLSWPAARRNAIAQVAQSA